MGKVQIRPFAVEHRRLDGASWPGGRVPVDSLYRSGRVVGFRDLSRFPVLREREEAVRIAREALNAKGADPNSDVCVLARQLLRALHID